jgi:hypothetical protein
MSFYSERPVKALRKPRQCQGCRHPMAVGAPALHCSGKHEGEFFTGHYHPDCHDAEMLWNAFGPGGMDDWTALRELDHDEIASFADQFPDVALRLRPQLVTS